MRVKLSSNAETVDFRFELQIPFDAELEKLRDQRSLMLKRHVRPETNMVGEADMALLAIGTFFAAKEAWIIGKSIVAPLFGHEQIFASDNTELPTTDHLSVE